MCVVESQLAVLEALQGRQGSATHVLEKAQVEPGDADDLSGGGAGGEAEDGEETHETHDESVEGGKGRGEGCEEKKRR